MKIMRAIGALKLVHVEVGEFVEIDGTSRPTQIVADSPSGLVGMGCFKVPSSGIYLITAQGSTGWRNSRLLHIQGSLSLALTDEKAALAQYDSIIVNKHINGIDISDKLAS